MARKSLRRVKLGPVARGLGLKKGDRVTVRPIQKKPTFKVVGSGRSAKVKASRVVEVSVTRQVGNKFGRVRKATFT